MKTIKLINRVTHYVILIALALLILLPLLHNSFNNKPTITVIMKHEK